MPSSMRTAASWQRGAVVRQSWAHTRSSGTGEKNYRHAQQRILVAPRSQVLRVMHKRSTEVTTKSECS
eukprot:scaffold278956_cov24-Tisochrysis_lutea.AAC.1